MKSLSELTVSGERPKKVLHVCKKCKQPQWLIPGSRTTCNYCPTGTLEVVPEQDVRREGGHFRNFGVTAVIKDMLFPKYGTTPNWLWPARRSDEVEHRKAA